MIKRGAGFSINLGVDKNLDSYIRTCDKSGTTYIAADRLRPLGYPRIGWKNYSSFYNFLFIESGPARI